jgi:hypothetical protein
MDFDWDEGNLGHIAQHHITPEETEQVIANRPFDIKVQLRRNEERYLHVGNQQGSYSGGGDDLARGQGASGYGIRRKPTDEEIL